jgi:hypothetical protein
LLSGKLLNQGFLLVKLKSSLRMSYGRHHDLVDRYGISMPQMTTDMFHMGKLKSSPLSSSFVLNRPSLSISRCRSRYETGHE